MKKFYLIPITKSGIYLNGQSLSDILKITYPELYEMESERIRILYSTSPLLPMPPSEEIRYKEHLEKTKRRYDELQVPQYLIAYGNDAGAKEILSNGIITSRHPAYIGIREANERKVDNYYEDSNYYVKLINYLNSIETINKDNNDDTLDITAYIDGYIGKKHIKGNFNGKIKIKELNKSYTKREK